MIDLRPETTRSTFVLSFDFEDWHQLVHRRIGRPDWRDWSEAFRQHIATLLDLLDELNVNATFFVAGVTADRHPGALEEVVTRGHEVGCHGYEHRRAYRQVPDEFKGDVSRTGDLEERFQERAARSDPAAAARRRGALPTRAVPRRPRHGPR